jgi:hypothetical protein
LSDWDIDVTESVAANKFKSTVRYTAPPQKRKADPKPDPEEYDDEYYEEEEDEQVLQEVDDEGDDVQVSTPAVEAPSPDLKPKAHAAKETGQARTAPTKHKP